MNPLFIAIAVFSLGAFIHIVLRLWGGNLRRGEGDRAPLGLGAFLGVAAGATYMAGYMLKWNPAGEWLISHRWSRKGLQDPSDYLEWAELWLADYFDYGYELTYSAAVAFEWWPILPEHLLPAVLGLVAFWAATVVWRMSRRKPNPGFVQDLGVGFIATLGMAPFSAVAFGVGYILLLVICLLLLGMWGRGFGWLLGRS